ncbi:MAG TPA: flagellar hook capping FlgD N-terminal domain-containing protein [Bryobacteraceae bacterium]|nr:flagellar hook capping FlgD N-terminal domain-containing protein [Bryobacteraceae bacterium]
MASAINALLGSAATSGATGSSPAAGGTAGLPGTAPTEQMFLQLLVAQIQNQDPLNPTDSTQFVSQLAQFSELENVVAIRGDIEGAMSSQSNNAAAAAASGGANTNPAVPGAAGSSAPTSNGNPSTTQG